MHGQASYLPLAENAYISVRLSTYPHQALPYSVGVIQAVENGCRMTKMKKSIPNGEKGFKMSICTDAGKHFLNSMTEWLQHTRLMSEAVYRLQQEFEADGNARCTKESWPKPSKKEPGGSSFKDFKMERLDLAQRMQTLNLELWKSQFIFLESLWEQYLQELVLELKEKDATIFEPFCDREFMSDIVRKVLVEDIETIEEVKSEVAARFAAGITRCPWREQWKQLSRLRIGIGDKEAKESWFQELDVYFEMRNCLIHRQGKVSTLLNTKTTYYTGSGKDAVVIWPTHIDFYRKQFLACLNQIESKIAAKYHAENE